MIDGRNFFDQPKKKKDLKTYDNITKTATDQGDYYTTGFYQIIPISKVTIN